MKAGPKGAVSTQPLDLSSLPSAGPKRVTAFCRTFLKVPKGTGALKPFILRPWQVEIVAGLFPHPNTGKRPRQALCSLPRGNGKSALAAAIALCALFGDGEEGAQVPHRPSSRAWYSPGGTSGRLPSERISVATDIRVP